MFENTYSAENAVIGSMMLDPQLVGEIIHAVTLDDFRQDMAKTVFSVIQAQFLSGLTLDPVTISEKLSGDERQFMAECMRATPTANNIEAYTELVRRSGLLHRRQLLGMQLADAQELEETEGIINRIVATSAGTHRDAMFQTGAQAADSFYSELNERSENGTRFIEWGISPLDASLHTRHGNYVVIGARTSTGKSALALQCALRMASAGLRVGFVSLEMSNREMNDRCIAHLSGVSLDGIARGKLSDTEWKRVYEACEALYKLPIGFDYSCRTVAQIQARALSERWDVVFVDYLQLVNGEKKFSRYELVTEISQGLQQLAHRNNILVVALSQLSRPQKTADGQERKPTLTDLRESGQVEQDADAVILISLTDCNDKQSDRYVQLAKNRQGQCCDFYMSFDGDKQRFTYKERWSHE